MSYTALRSSTVQGDRFVLNGRPYLLRMVLDQGYWPESGLTAPDDAALRRDVELAKAMGFNGVRKHQKIEDPRYLYWADRLGLPSGRRCRARTASRRQSVERLTPRMDRRRSRATTAIPASSRGCRSTNRGACRTCPTIATRAALRAGALSPDANARSDAAGDRQRRLGERRHRHHRHPRLRRSARPHRAGAITPTKCCRGCSSASARAAGCWCSRGTTHADQPLMLTEFGGIALSRETGHVGLLAVRHAGGVRAPLPRAARRRPRAAGVLGVLLHAVRRHVPGSQRPALCRSHAEVPARGDRGGDAPARVAVRADGLEQLTPRRSSVECTMHKRRLTKPDGRALLLYATRADCRGDLDAPSPQAPRRCAERAPALAPAARRMGRLRRPSPEPHVPAAARIQPARADDRPGASDRGAGGQLGRRGVREPVPDASTHDGARSAGAWRCRPRRARASARSWSSRRTRRRRSDGCRSGTSSC